MSRLFSDESLDIAVNASAVLTGPPMTMACWVFPDEALTCTAMSIADPALATHFFRIGIGSTFTAICATRAGGTEALATTTATGAINTWMHIAGVFVPNGAITDTRTAYLSGANAVSNLTDHTPANMGETGIGFKCGSTDTLWFSGRIAEAAIWDVVLDAAELLTLAAGFSPLLVRPSALAAYWPFISRASPEIDIVGGFNLTLTGTAVAEHPRILYPDGVVLGRHTDAAPAAGHPAMARWHGIPGMWPGRPLFGRGW